MTEENTFFPYLKNLFTKENKLTSNSQEQNMFMILRYLSMHPEGFFIASEVNKLNSKLPTWATGCLLYYLLPKKSKAPFMAYTKIKKKELSPRVEEILTKIGELFCCNLEQANDIYSLLIKQSVDVEAAFGLNREGGTSANPKGKDKSTEITSSVSKSIAKWKTK